MKKNNDYQTEPNYCTQSETKPIYICFELILALYEILSNGRTSYNGMPWVYLK